MLHKKRSAFASMFLITVCALMSPSSAAAQTETVLYSFGSSSTDAASPWSGLIADKTSLYGTANIGGQSGHGAVFQLTRPSAPGGAWTETVLYSFTGGSDGSRPFDTLAMDAVGALYGTTTFGGTNGDGVVFQLTPPAVSGGAWTYNVLHTFAGVDGATPYSGVAIDKNGVLYGTTSAGGKFGVGTVYQLTPPAVTGGSWTEAVLYNFSSAKGAASAHGCEPYAGVTLSPTGALYGTTQACGASNGGVVYKLTPPASGHTNWSQLVLHSFVAGGSEGYAPMAGVTIGPNRTLFGCTQAGNGSAFELTPPTTVGGSWSEQVLSSVPGNCQSKLVIDQAGVVYGTTLLGGANAAGNVFELIPPAGDGAWTLTDLYDFTGNADGGFPQAGLLLRGGVLYGTASAGADTKYASGGAGTVFKLVP